MAAAAPTLHSQDLQWLLVRKSNSYIVKQKGLGKVFSREPRNLAQIHSYTYSGLVNNKAVGIEPASSGKGIVISTKKSKSPSNKVAGTWNTQTIKKGGSRRYAGAVANVVGKKGYRADLLKPAVARASIISRSQRPRKAALPQKPRGKKAAGVTAAPAATEEA